MSVPTRPRRKRGVLHGRCGTTRSRSQVAAHYGPRVCGVPFAAVRSGYGSSRKEPEGEQNARALAKRPVVYGAMNRHIAGRLEEAAWLLRDQGADPFRVNAYLRAAATVRHWPEPLIQVFHDRGLDGVEELPGVGPSIARAIRELLTRGRLPMLDRLRGAADPLTVLASVPGIGPRLAERLHDELGINTLEQLEAAAHDGRLATLAGFGQKRITGIRDSLAHRLGRVRSRSEAPRNEPPVAELLDVDREYREKAAAGLLRLITPKRFNPTHEAWLPILHTERGPWHFSVLFSNTGLAHSLGRTKDWVVIYFHYDSEAEGQRTVVTETRGPLCGARVVRGRERECEEHYRLPVQLPLIVA